MKYVTYRRVSTREQGDSGLGLEAQDYALSLHAGSNPIVATFTEIESGKRCDRPQLQAAIAACRANGATLLIAKLDRLARNVAFIAALMESGIEFVCCDNPNATKLTIHILAGVAEDEARRISERTKAALAALKARGVRLGSPQPMQQSVRVAGTAANIANAESHHAKVRGMAKGLRDSGYTLEAIADTLTGAGLLTRRKLPWTGTAVYRLLA
jgi:DNA invertase Pin-like site-specific DNA recombinase